MKIAKSFLLILVLGSALFTGCETHLEGLPDAQPDSLVDAPIDTPVDPWQTLLTRNWSLAPGLEGYLCRTIQLPDDLYVTGFRPVAPAGTLRLMLTVTDSSSATGDYNCSASTNMLQPARLLYGAGTGTQELAFPPGVGIHLPKGKFLTINLEVANPGSTTLAGSSGVVAKIASAAEVTTEAEMFLVGTLSISIPSDSQPHIAQGGCNSPYTSYQLLSLWPMMRGLGVEQKVIVTHAGVPSTVLDKSYDWQHEDYDVLASPFTVRQGDQLSVTCTYVNATGSTVTFGDSSTDENCFAGLYRIPSQQSTNPFECVN